MHHRPPFRPWLLLVALMLAAAIGFAGKEAEPAARRLVDLRMNLANPVALAGAPQHGFLKIGLLGTTPVASKDRPPINLALVMDRSGSMSGDKIARARDAALMVVERLAPDDIFSFVVYSDTVEVIVPATKIADRAQLEAAIRRVEADGNTALFAGISKGAAEVRKFLDQNRVNRVILLSDGLANVGPSNPADLISLGGSLIREGISVSTVGLGTDWNEELMHGLAAASDGVPSFAAEPSDLAAIFDRELDAAKTVVASQLDLEVEFLGGVRPVRVLGDRAQIEDGKVKLRFGQLYHDWENYMIVEVEIPQGSQGTTRPVANARVRYRNLVDNRDESCESAAEIRYTDQADEVAKAGVNDVQVAVVALTAAENTRKAVTLADQGQQQAAQQVLEFNQSYLRSNSVNLQSDYLGKLSTRNATELQNLGKEDWKVQRLRAKSESQGDVWRVKQ